MKAQGGAHGGLLRGPWATSATAAHSATGRVQRAQRRRHHPQQNKGMAELKWGEGYCGLHAARAPTHLLPGPGEVLLEGSGLAPGETPGDGESPGEDGRGDSVPGSGLQAVGDPAFVLRKTVTCVCCLGSAAGKCTRSSFQLPDWLKRSTKRGLCGIPTQQRRRRRQRRWRRQQQRGRRRGGGGGSSSGGASSTHLFPGPGDGGEGLHSPLGFSDGSHAGGACR